jgi:hypothetical protein
MPLCKQRCREKWLGEVRRFILPLAALGIISPLSELTKKLTATAPPDRLAGARTLRIRSHQSKLAMSRTVTVAIGLVFSAMLSAVPAYAQQPRTFVSPTGSDSNPCTLVAPCRTFQVAIAQTDSGGEIAVLGSAGYNAGATFNIDRPISIVNPGAFEAGIVVPSGGNGITFTTSGAVSLRGLTIEGNGTGSTGIFYSGVAGSLTIQQCIVRNVTGDGIAFSPNGTSSLTVSDSYVTNNGGDGIDVVPTGGVVTAVFNRVEADNNAGDGIGVDGNDGAGTINATVVDSAASGNTGNGFVALAPGRTMNLMLIESVAANNGTGLAANGADATLWVGQSAVTGNANGWQAINGGAVQSFGTNQIVGNAASQTQIPAVQVNTCAPAIMHQDGLGQTFCDFNPLGTYNEVTATEAAAAWVISQGGSPANIQQGQCINPNPQVEVVSAANSCAAWSYTAPAGHVLLGSGVNNCQCPTISDPTWD